MRQPRYTREDLTLANAFTVLRIIGTPVFGWEWARGDAEVALWVFFGAVLTDLVDGFLARFLNQKSRLGALLDPIADKLLMLVALLVGVTNHAIPVWLVVCILGRDAVLLAGALVLHTGFSGRHGPAAWRPTRLGKYAMLLQSSTIAFAIVEDVLAPRGFLPWVRVLMIMTATLTIIAGAQYVARASLALVRTRTAQTKRPVV